MGNKLTETDRRGQITTFAYDDLDRLVQINDPPALGYVQTFTYDAVGNRLTETDRQGIRTEFSYDKENRLTHVKRAGLQIRMDRVRPERQPPVRDRRQRHCGRLYDDRLRIRRTEPPDQREPRGNGNHPLHPGRHG